MVPQQFFGVTSLYICFFNVTGDRRTLVYQCMAPWLQAELGLGGVLQMIICLRVDLVSSVCTAFYRYSKNKKYNDDMSCIHLRFSLAGTY